jgi:hypothetical protein
VFPPQSDIAFINTKNCISSSVVSFLLCTLNVVFELCHIWQSVRVLASKFHNYGTWHIGTSTSYALKATVRAGFRWDCTCLKRKACFMALVWPLTPDIVLDFNILIMLVTSNITESVTLWVRSRLQSWTNFFLFKKLFKLSVD